MFFLAKSLLQSLDHLVIIRKPSLLELGVDLLTIQQHFIGENKIKRTYLHVIRKVKQQREPSDVSRHY